MNKNLYYQKTVYVESLKQALSAMEDFDDIAYARSSVTEEEYLRITDKIGGVVYIDVTAESNEDILKDVAKIVLNAETNILPKGVITDKPKLREISELFRRKPC